MSKRPYRPHRRPIRPGHVDQVTVSPLAAAEIMHQHGFSSTTEIPLNNENIISAEIANSILTQQAITDGQQFGTKVKVVLPGIRPQLPINPTIIRQQINSNSPHITAVPNSGIQLNPNQFEYPFTTLPPPQISFAPQHQLTIFGPDRNYSPFDYDYQPHVENELLQNSPFFQNSKLHNFFQSPYYTNNILPDQRVFDRRILPSQRLLQQFAQSEFGQRQPQPNQFTREAMFYKDFLNNRQGISGVSHAQLINQVPVNYGEQFQV